MNCISCSREKSGRRLANGEMRRSRRIEFADELEPEKIAAHLRALGEDCDAVSVIAADHPLIGQAIHALKAKGKPVVAYITDQSAPTGRLCLHRQLEARGGPPPGSSPRPPTAGSGGGLHRQPQVPVSGHSGCELPHCIPRSAGDLAVEDSRPTHEDPEKAYQIVAGLLPNRRHGWYLRRRRGIPAF